MHHSGTEICKGAEAPASSPYLPTVWAHLSRREHKCALFVLVAFPNALAGSSAVLFTVSFTNPLRVGFNYARENSPRLPQKSLAALPTIPFSKAP